MDEIKKEVTEGLPDPENVDKLDGLNLDGIKDLPPEEQLYLRVQQAVMLVQSMNAIETSIHQIEEDIRHRIPTTNENIKIISSRIADLKKDQIDNLTLDFIKNLFVVEGEEVKVTLPELAEYNKELFDDLEFYKLFINYVKIYDEQLAEARSWFDKVKAKFDSEVPPEAKAIVSSFETLTEYMDNYFYKKSEDPNIPEEQREAIKESMKWSKYGITLDPIKENLQKQLKEKGSLGSILHNYRNNMRRVVEGAYKVCDNIGVRYPFRIIDNVEAKIFEPDEYKDYKYLFMFIISRYIKYVGSAVNRMEKIFLSQLISNMVVLSRIDNDHPHTKLADEMRPHIKEVLDLVIKNK